MSIRFSGNAAQVQSTFHTEIHNLVVNGVAHIANMSDPQIPAALSPVVVGVKSLHNFFPHPLHHLGSLVTKDSKTGGWLRPPAAAGAVSNLKSAIAAPAPRTRLAGPAAGSFSAKPAPQFGINGTDSNGNPYLVEDVGPYDFATIYNVLPLWAAGIDGSGQTIAIAGTSSIVPNDVATFRNFFLPSYTSTPAPTLISGNSSPLTVCTDTTGTLPFPANPCEIGDLIENSLDVEWSGSIAPKAQIVLVSSYPSSTTDDTLYDSESFIVNHLTARIMNVSYGECELVNGTAGNVQYYDLWQTAASEGIAVFVATGDSGSASCDAGGDSAGVPYAAEYGLSVSGIASTPYNTAVGGTDFNWCSLTATECTAAPYWSTTNTANANAPRKQRPRLRARSSLERHLHKSGSPGVDGELLEGRQLPQLFQQLRQCHRRRNRTATPLYYYDRSYRNRAMDRFSTSSIPLAAVVAPAVASSIPRRDLHHVSGTCTTGATSTGATTNPDTGAAQASLSLAATAGKSLFGKPESPAFPATASATSPMSASSPRTDSSPQRLPHLRLRRHVRLRLRLLLQQRTNSPGGRRNLRRNTRHGRRHGPHQSENRSGAGQPQRRALQAGRERNLLQLQR